MYIIGIWKSNSCFMKPSAPKQPQGKYLTKWTNFLRRMLSGGNMLLACALTGLRQCLVAIPVFRPSVKKKSPDAIDKHCIIHHQTLMVKTMPDE